MNERIGKHLNDALRHIERIIEKTRSLEYDDFNDDFDTIDIVERNIITFTEALNRIEEREPGFCESHEIEFAKIKGLRNIIVHQYDYVHYEALFEIITKHIPKLKEQLEKITVAAHEP